VGILMINMPSSELNVYPSPAQSFVNIKFSNDSRSQVSIFVYNMSGQKVYTLLNEMYPEGNHQITWEFDTELNPGIYLLRMNAGEKMSAAKMIVQ